MPRHRLILYAYAFALLALAPAAATAHPATGIVADAQGRIHFSDLETVWRLDAGGRLTVFRPAVRGRHVRESSVDEDGNVYVADHGRRRVLKVGADGKVSRVVRAEALWSPTGVAAARDGRVLVLEAGFTPPNVVGGPRVRELSPDGVLKVLVTVGLGENAASRPTSSCDAGAEGETVVEYDDNVGCVERALGIYFGLGVVAIGAIAGLRGFARRSGHA